MDISTDTTAAASDPKVSATDAPVFQVTATDAPLFSIEVTEAPLARISRIVEEGRRAGFGRKKGWYLRIETSFAACADRGGALARVDRVFPRGGQYTETVTMCDTGEVIHHCDEPLSAHRGHGSDKKYRG